MLSPFTEEDVYDEVKSMRQTRALGIDGFSAIFYQTCWHIVGKEVSLFYLETLNKGLNFERFNSTNIALILKVPNPSKMVNFHPISLCNFFYKIIAKMFTNRY